MNIRVIASIIEHFSERVINISNELHIKIMNVGIFPWQRIPWPVHGVMSVGKHH